MNGPAAVLACALDFDGVVLESVDVKLAAFKSLFAGRANAARIAAYLEEHNGVDRYTKFRHIWTEMLGLAYDADVEARLDAEFNALVFDAVCACPFVPGAEGFLNGTKLPLYVVSAMPLRDLRLIVERRGLTPRFRGLYGAPGRKADQLREILGREGLAPDRLAFVGDSPNDYKAAREAGVRFVGRRNAEDFGSADAEILPDLRGLGAALAAFTAPCP